MDFESIALVIGAISMLAGVAAAIAAFRAARETRKSVEAELVLQFLDHYASDEMLNALRVLRMWEAEHGEGFEKVWRERLDLQVPEAHTVDQARRRVKNYFLNALRLFESQYVDREFLAEVCSVDGINIFYDIVEKLELALNEKYDQSRFQRIADLCGRARSGELMDPVPPAPSRGS